MLHVHTSSYVMQSGWPLQSTDTLSGPSRGPNKKKRRFFPLNPGWLMGILISVVLKSWITGFFSCPILILYTLNNQGPFCSLICICWVWPTLRMQSWQMSWFIYSHGKVNYFDGAFQEKMENITCLLLKYWIIHQAWIKIFRRHGCHARSCEWQDQ